MEMMMHNKTIYVLLVLLVCSSIANCQKDSLLSKNVKLEQNNVNFETSHKIPNENEFITSHKIMYGDHKPLIRMSSKTKPSIDSQLGLLIGQDIAKAIDADRRSFSENSPAHATKSLLYSENDDFVDQSILFDEAGTETKQTSRIQIKKGPNGQEYEYEYVYYYDDDDEVVTDSKNEHEKPVTTEKAQTEETLLTTTAHSSTSTTTTEKKVEKVEERLPATRFPPRESAVSDPDSNNDEVTKKVNVNKRPNVVELVDSHSFNTEHKNFKANRQFETEVTENNPKVKNAIDSNSEIKKTTMDKSALDLYAILSNEKQNNDVSVNDNSLDSTTFEIPTTTFKETTTTTEEPTTTTTTTTTEPPTTTTEEAPTRRMPFQGTNRFRLGGTSNVERKTTTTTQAPEVTKKAFGNRYKNTSSFNNRATSRAAITTTTTEETVEKEVEVTTKAPSKLNTRARNRFNLQRPAETSTASSPIERPRISSYRARPKGKPVSVTTEAPEEVSVASEETETGAKNDTQVPAEETPKEPTDLRKNLKLRPNRLLNRKISFTKTVEQPSENSNSESTTKSNNSLKLNGRTRGNKLQETTTSQPTTTPASKLIRRPNLLQRRKFGAAASTTAEPTTSDLQVENSTNTASESSEADDSHVTEAVEVSTEVSTPKVFSLLSRRKLASRRPGTI